MAAPARAHRTVSTYGIDAPGAQTHFSSASTSHKLLRVKTTLNGGASRSKSACRELGRLAGRWQISYTMLAVQITPTPRMPNRAV